TSGMGLVLEGRGPVVLTGHADTSWVDDSAMQRSSQGYTFSLGSVSVSWRSSRSSSVLSSSCEAEIYVGAMAAQELRWLTYLLTYLGEQPCSAPVPYVDNKVMIALCHEHRLEHIMKHIGLRYFLARDLQQRGQLCLAYVATRANTADIFTKALPPDHPGQSTAHHHTDSGTRVDLPYSLSLLARYVAPGRHQKVNLDAAKRVLRYLCSTSGMGLVLGGRGPVVLTGHADASWELRWFTYLLTVFGEPPRSPPVLYVDNKAMIALCQEHRLEHRTKHIALRYFLAREMQQRGQLRLAYVATRAKALPPGDHQRFSTVLGLVRSRPHSVSNTSSSKVNSSSSCSSSASGSSAKASSSSSSWLHRVSSSNALNTTSPGSSCTPGTSTSRTSSRSACTTSSSCDSSTPSSSVSSVSSSSSSAPKAWAPSKPLTQPLRSTSRTTRRSSNLSLSTPRLRTLRLSTPRLNTPSLHTRRLSTPRLLTPRPSTPRPSTLRLCTPRRSTPQRSTWSST
ncbi:unnamed protein product, partial [Closterium sp. NIES-54]